MFASSTVGFSIELVEGPKMSDDKRGVSPNTIVVMFTKLDIPGSLLEEPLEVHNVTVMKL